MKLTDRVQHAWNAFVSGETDTTHLNVGVGQGMRPRHKQRSRYSESSFAASIFNRIAIDVAITEFSHNRYNEESGERTKIDSGLHYCLTTEANLDQSSKAFMQDLVYSMFDEGVVAVVPIETSTNPEVLGFYDIHSMRVGKITEWYPKHVRVELYNQESGNNEEVLVEKRNTAILENPLYPVTNGDNSVLKRLLRKINDLDKIEDRAGSSNLDIVITLPHPLKTKAQQKAAKERIQNIEEQLTNSRKGIAYVDGTEKVTQLNRPTTDQLAESIDKLTRDLYNQLGLTQKIFDGTANEAELRVYYSRTIDPIIEFITDEFERKFLTKTARTQGHEIDAYRDMFKFISTTNLADTADKLKRNVIVTTNEVRDMMRLKPSDDPKADQLYNPNMPDDDQGLGIERRRRRKGDPEEQEEFDETLDGYSESED